MLTYDLSARGGKTIYEYLYECVRNDILAGRIISGEKLPSKRSLADHLQISVISVENAYEQLLAEGYIYSLPRKGFYASDVSRMLFPPAPAAGTGSDEEQTPAFYKLDTTSNRIDLSLFPFSVWRKLSREILTDADTTLLSQTTTQGLYCLRRAIASHLANYRGMQVDPDRIIIGSGAEYLYMILSQLLDDSAVLAIEDPGYSKIQTVYERSRRKTVPIPLDEGGLSYEALCRTDASVVHVSPAHHFPTGIVMPIARRQQLLSWADRKNGFIIEDDYDSELRFSGRPIPTIFQIDMKSRVIYMNTFSQTIFPSLRMSYMILPEDMMDRYIREMAIYRCPVSAPEQLIVTRFLDDGHYEKHLMRLRKNYRDRRGGIIRLFQSSPFSDRIRIYEDPSGLHFLMYLRTDAPDDVIKEKAASLGIRLAFLSDYSISDEPGYRHTLVINYAGLSPEKLSEHMDLVVRLFETI